MPQFKANLDLSTLTGSNGFRINGVLADDYSGHSVSSAGDVNGDGFDDVIIGTDGIQANGDGSGASYVVFGGASGFAADLELDTLDGSNGFRIDDERSGDLSGNSVSAAGDVNGDGFADVIVGAPGADANSSESGASYVVFGKAGGFESSIDVSSLDGSSGFRIIGESPGDRSGYSVSMAGDVNGDGFADIIVGAHTANPNGHHSGASYVVFGKAGGFAADLDLGTLDGDDGFRISGEAARGLSGRSVSSAGDVNGDGFDDVIVGADATGPNGFHSGASYVVFGKASGFAADLELGTLDGSNGFKINGAATGDRSGFSVSNAGDVNGDGIDDLIVGAFAADPNGSYSGASYVVFGKAGGFGASLELSNLNGSTGFQISGTATSDSSGWSVSSAGDVNGDGFDDVIIGTPNADPNGSGSGASYVVFGKVGGFNANLDLSTLDGNSGFQISGVSRRDLSGSSVSSAGDVNGDGFDDLIVGAPGAGTNQQHPGATYVIFGHRALTAVTITGTDIAQTSNGGHGGDTISGNGGNDRLIGWEGADTLNGGTGADTLQGDGGADTLSGGDAADTLQGGNGADTLNGNDGSDTLSGGLKRDSLTGGAGDDVFTFLSVNEGRDTITDFTDGGVAGGDRIDVSAIDAIAGGGDDDFAFGGTTATANGVWYSVGPARATVFLDTDGDTATAELVIYLSGVTSLAQGDFIL